MSAVSTNGQAIASDRAEPVREGPERSLRITETFFSLQGESSWVGLPTTFIRLTGCPLRCVYCDSEYAFHGGSRISFDSLIETVKGNGSPYVCVTGGEPLAQPGVLRLLAELCDSQFKVSLETSGAIEIQDVDPRVKIVMDLKTPSSEEASKNRLGNIAHLRAKDEVKFVIGDRKDFEFSVAMLEQELSMCQAEVLFSPIYNKLDPALLAEWILQAKLPVRFQMQMHKTIWGDTPGV